MGNSSDKIESIRIKIVTLGSVKVGKSCLIKKHCEPSRFASSYIPTIGVDYGINTVKNEMEDGKCVNIKIDFYDLSGEYTTVYYFIEPWYVSALVS